MFNAGPTSDELFDYTPRPIMGNCQRPLIDKKLKFVDELFSIRCCTREPLESDVRLYLFSRCSPCVQRPLGKEHQAVRKNPKGNANPNPKRHAIPCLGIHTNPNPNPKTPETLDITTTD